MFLSGVARAWFPYLFLKSLICYQKTQKPDRLNGLVFITKKHLKRCISKMVSQVLTVQTLSADRIFRYLSPRAAKRLILYRWLPPTRLPDLLRNSAQPVALCGTSSTDDSHRPACQTCFATRLNSHHKAPHPPPMTATVRLAKLALQLGSTSASKLLTPPFFVNFCACKNRGMLYSLLIKKHYCSQLLSNQSWFQKCFLF